MKRLFTMQETADRLGISKSRLSQLVQAGKIVPRPMRFTERSNSPMFFKATAMVRK